MPVMKQKSIQPATNVPYSEGILVTNDTPNPIPAGRMVTFQRTVGTTATSGATLTVELADASSAARSKNPLLVTKHAIPAGKRGVCLPWMMLTGLDTSALNVGDNVYLAAGANLGAPKLTAGAVGGGADRIIGVVFEKSAVGEATGRIFCCPTLMAGQN